MQNLQRFARHKARVLALQSLYERLVSGNSVEKIVQSNLEFCAEKRWDKDYFVSLFQGVVDNLDKIDSYLISCLDRPIAQLMWVELCILRLATFELTGKIGELSYPIVIDEAVRLSKEFGSECGYKYINAVLDRVAKGLQVA